MPRRAIALQVLSLAVAVGGCSVGQKALRTDYPQYNQTVRELEDEHMVLNLVRVRYLETPVFLQISQIATSYSVSVDASGSLSIASTGVEGGSTGAGVGYSESPTITYSLPESREYFGRMLAPLAATQLAVPGMTGTGTFLRLGVKKINGLENLSTYTGWEVKTPGTYDEFEEAITLAGELEAEGLIDFALAYAANPASSPFDELRNTLAIPEAEKIGMEFYKNEDGKWVAYFAKKTPHLRFSRAAADSPRATRLRELLGLRPDRHTFPVVDADFSATESGRRSAGEVAAALDPDAEWGEVALHNRSMMEVLLHASKGVEVPEAHRAAGIATAEDGGPGLLRIRTSTEMPAGAAVRVKYMGHWFYIPENDLESKMMLARLNVLMATTAGSVPGSQPVLTLPVR